MEGNTRTNKQLLPPPHPYPWLLFFNGEGAEETQNFYTISDPTKNYPRMIPELGAATLWSMQHGWCLLANYHTENITKVFLWNPFDLTKINLPPLKCNFGDVNHKILISSPTATICSIFLFSMSTSIFYWYLGDKQWTKVDYEAQLLSAPAMEGEEFTKGNIWLYNPFYYNGCLYAESWKKPRLIVEIKKLEPSGLKISSSHIFSPRIPTSIIDQKSKMLESNKEIFRIEILHLHDKVVDVVVHKLDFLGKVWHKVESIDNRVFFISDGSSFACQTITPETDGCGRVYISLEKHKFVYIYNIEDKTVMPFLKKKRSHSWWFMPNLRTTGSIKEGIGMSRIKEKESSDKIHSKKMRNTVTYDEFALCQDMVEEIAKHIDIGIDYLHFRATNRFFHLSTQPIQWRSCSSLSMSRFDNLSSSPLFVYFEKDYVLTFVHPKHGLKYKYNISLTMDPQPYCEICYSKDGWLLMVVNKSSSFFFNPFAKEQEKPHANGPADKNLNTRCIAFSHSPTSSECMVVELERLELYHPYMRVYITKLGLVEWHQLNFENFEFSLYNISPVFYKGEFYYLTKKGKLVVLKVGEEAIYLKVLENPKAPCTNYDNSFLAECNGHLLSIFEGRFGKWVRVFKLNESTKTWIRVGNLGNHMLFVGNTSFSAMANVSGMENKIYFPRFYDHNIVFYSLETNNYHTFESTEVVNFRCMRDKVNCSWIEPRFF